MAATKRKGLSLKRKLEIVDLIESSKASIRQLSRQLNIPKSTLHNIRNEKEQLKIRRLSGTQSFDSQRQRSAQHDHLEGKLLDWLCYARSQHVPCSGPVLKGKANQFAKELGIDGWECSEGWLSRWKKRHNIVCRVECGERGSVDEQATDKWVENVLVPLLTRYESRDIFNLDETALFWRLLPAKTMCVKGDRCVGGKRLKERITVMLCANMDGTEKLPLLTIGKFKNPRCFSGIKRLPVQYQANQKAWMTAEIFVAWLKDFDHQMSKQKRKVLLFLDNCTAHKLSQLTATEVVFFPTNATSKLQPCDTGIIHNLKQQYRSMKVYKLIDHVEAGGKTENYPFSLFDALCTLQEAWEKVTPTTIVNCFRKAGFSVAGTGSSRADVITEGDLPEIQPSKDPLLAKLFEEYDIPLSDYFFVDEEVATAAFEIPSACALEAIPSTSYVSSGSKFEELDSDVDDLGDPENVSKGVVVNCLQKIRTYCLQANCTCCDSALRELTVALDKHYMFCQKQQTKITDYFIPSPPSPSTPSPPAPSPPAPSPHAPSLSTPSPPAPSPSPPASYPPAPSPTTPPLVSSPHPTPSPAPPVHSPPQPIHTLPPMAASFHSAGERCHCTPSDISNTPSYPVYDYLTPLLSSMERRIDYIRADGNCFFRCLSKEMHGTESFHGEFRQTICDLIDKHPGVFAQYLDGGDTVNHVKEMRKLGKWATTCEIYASAALLQREIYMLTPIPGSQKLASATQNFEYRWLLFSPDNLSSSGEEGPAYLTLCNTNGIHYDRIVPTVVKCNCEIATPMKVTEEDTIVLDLH